MANLPAPYAIIAISPRSPAPFQKSIPSAIIEEGIGLYSSFINRAKWRKELIADSFPSKFPKKGKNGFAYSA